MPFQLPDEHDLGLTHDLRFLLNRRAALRLLASAGSAALAGCSSPSETTVGSSASSSSSGSGGGGASGQCVAHPAETNGPYPADGTNSANGSIANVLIESGVVRSDIRSSFGGLSGTAEGVRVDLTIAIVNSNNACAPLEGYPIYIWHCDAAGRYSIYNLPAQNYLRGVGVAGADGRVTFTTIFPGCYPGRYPHIHFEVYPSLAQATHYSNRRLVSQMALPENACSAVYNAIAAYSASRSPYAGTSIASDGIFGDNTSAQIAAQTIALSGDPYNGYTGEITVGLAL